MPSSAVKVQTVPVQYFPNDLKLIVLRHADGIILRIQGKEHRLFLNIPGGIQVFFHLCLFRHLFLIFLNISVPIQ